MSEDRLLIIDDDAGFRNFVRRVAEDAGFDTQITGEAPVFKELVRSWNPSVLVLDLNMPGVDGIELLRDLVDMRVGARVVIASGVDVKVLETVGRLAAERGLKVAATLQKPVRAEGLREVLEKLREVERELLAGALADAITSDSLILEYLPTLDCKSGRIASVEALVRWKHPTRGMIPPDQFISLAERSEVIHQLTHWVVANAAHQTLRWRRAGLDLALAVNASPRNLENPGFPDEIAALCAQSSLPPEKLTIEMVSASVSGDLAYTRDTLSRLRLKGFRLSMEEFGTGDLSLSKLRRLPFTELKIDKPFVTQMMHDEDSRRIVEAAIGLARKFELNAVAVGVTMRTVLAAVRELGADAAQGFFISPPIDADRVLDIAAKPAAPAAAAS
jgi:EAL domain-containing protein (putative c-di-GMP-specific phosphodiesterase class I)/ActR/RegA family two-component response regulator